MKDFVFVSSFWVSTNLLFSVNTLSDDYRLSRQDFFTVSLDVYSEIQYFYDFFRLFAIRSTQSITPNAHVYILVDDAVV